jgi:hypothetical protein
VLLSQTDKTHGNINHKEVSVRKNITILFLSLQEDSPKPLKYAEEEQ